MEHIEKNVNLAMKIFLSLAGLIYAIAFAYSYFTKNSLAQVLIISAAVVAAGIVFHLNKKE